MKRLFIFFCLILSSQVIGSEWKEIRRNYYVDLSRFTNNEIWVKVNYEIPTESIYDGRNVYSSLEKHRYSCEDQKLGVLKYIEYGDIGNVIYSIDVNQFEFRMNEVIPDSIGEVTLNIACELQKQGLAQ